ncbi:MAG: serine acetyltransferase [Deltaproteobacteria bacterium]|nr:serine acetyltransferase [Deltaproteobacteria bacterium]
MNPLAFFRRVQTDIDYALRHDPAARSRTEILLAYPGLHALWLHSVANGLWTRGHHLSARLLAHTARRRTGVEIHPGATIAPGVFIDHGMGVVIGETSVIEEGCLIYKGVVLGGTSLERKIRHPHLAKNVVVGSNACILGALHIGEGARIGSGSVVVRDVAPGATVVGVPGRVARSAKREAFAEQLDHASLPDPVTEIVRGLAHQNEVLLERLLRLEKQLGVASTEATRFDPDDLISGRRR